MDEKEFEVVKDIFRSIFIYIPLLFLSGFVISVWFLISLIPIIIIWLLSKRPFKYYYEGDIYKLASKVYDKW